jgi:hypothetical protein
MDEGGIEPVGQRGARRLMASAMIAPIHVAVINCKPLRFFRTPLDDGRPDLPWVAIDLGAVAMWLRSGWHG